jgi:hypothetical protein
MTENKIPVPDTPAPEQTPQPDAPIPLTGDTIIQGEGVVVYDSSVEIKGGVDEVWKLVSRWGLQKGGAAGLYLPTATERWLPASLRSLPTREQILGAKQLQPGDTVTDGPKGHTAVVLEHTDEGAGNPKTLLFRSRWNKRGWDYTYQLYVERGEDPGVTTLLARTRWGGASRPELTSKYAPRADLWFMNKMKRGIEERLDPEWGANTGTSEQSRRAAIANAIGGALGGRRKG